MYSLIYIREILQWK